MVFAPLDHRLMAEIPSGYRRGVPVGRAGPERKAIKRIDTSEGAYHLETSRFQRNGASHAASRVQGGGCV